MNFAIMLTLAATVSAAPAKPTKALEAGRGIFTANCTACHGNDAKGKQVMANAFGVKKSVMDLTTALADKTDAEVIKIVTEGLNGKMPPFKGKLDEAKLKDVVAYVRSLAPKTEKKADAKAPEAKKGDEKPAGKN
ncbi:MAG: c-type cytochrome [Elusimicrobia bacterium]|nr:c-type cytochrome [Elusimicrobiota bacterium]